ncbi:hypothetical protein KZ483_02575 [Paenibacillus sp. sptzw28]|uniref:hypothetical protein n=1 Tax=Paenibacillus sp. sptzw28 TaxID=715179 RepID=UPI001C6E25F2|nr:hypothetical protein [Paenibacillus sp. sptzw28]QYR21941.1 hypothetical protein KZ483_02575 [Paenibacillus sp. sptzw28]
MKNIIAGGIFFISGIILYVGIRIAASLNMNNVNGWSDPPGKFGTSLREIEGVGAHRLAIILITSGFLMIIWDVFLKEVVKKYIKSLEPINTEYKEKHEMENRSD